MKIPFFIFLIVALSGLALYGQAPEKRFVGNCSFSGFALLADSSYRGDIVNFTDRMGNGYNLTQLVVGYEIFDGRGLVFEIDTIHSSTNFTADVSVTAKVNRGFAPFGSGQVYNPTENGLIPPSSQEQAGLSPTQKARIDIHNVVTMQSLIGGRDSVYSITNVPDTTGLSPVLGDAFINSTADTLGLYNGAGWVLFFGGGSIEVADGLTILGDGTGGDPLRVDTTLLATRYYADSLFALADSLRADGDKSAPILVPVFDRNTQLDGCSTAETIYTGFLLIDNEAIDEGAITFEINASPATVTYDVYNADSTSYYFETSASRGAGVYFWEVSYTDSDGNNVGDTNAFDVMAGTPDSVLTVVQDSILVLRVCGVEISRDTISTGGGSGTVTSVALSLPSQFAVIGSPVTSSGTLSGTWNTQAANTVLAGPASGVDAAPTFRSLVAADITAGGGALGTGSAGQVAYWSGTNTLTGSANMTYSSPLLTLGGTGASLLLTPTSAPVNAAGKWYTSNTNRPRFMDGATDWPLVRGAAESFTTGSLLFAGTGGQAEQDNANLFWDNTLERMCIGTNNASSSVDTKLKIIGSGSGAAGRTALLIQNTNSGSAAQIQLFNNSDNGVVMQANGTGYPGGQSAVVSSIGDIDFRFTTNGGASSGGVAGVIFRLGGYGNTSQVYFLPSGTGPNPSALMGINTPTPARTLHVVGEARITDLTTDTPTRIVGADADGDLAEMTAGTGISFAGGQISSTSIQYLSENDTIYVCNDTCAYKTINQAMEYASQFTSPYDSLTGIKTLTVMFTTNSDGSLPEFTTGFDAEGGNWGNILVSATDTVLFNPASYANFLRWDNSNNIRISGVTMKNQNGNGATALYFNNCSNINLANVQVDSFGRALAGFSVVNLYWQGGGINYATGIGADFASARAYFRDVTIKNVAGYGIYASRNSDVHLRDMTVRYCEDGMAVNIGSRISTQQDVFFRIDPTKDSTLDLTINGGYAFLGESTGGTNIPFNQLTPLGFAQKSTATPTGYGSASGTTDGSGDITVSHGFATASIFVTATATGTTFYNVQVHSKTSTDFKIRFFDATGAAVTSTAVTADWIAKK